MSQQDQEACSTHPSSMLSKVEETPPEQQTEDPAAKDVSRRQLKAAFRVQKKLAAEFSDAVGSIQKQQEDRMQAGGMGCQIAKERRLALKGVLKAVSDSSLLLEDRMRVLQSRFVEVLQDQLKQDQQMAELQTQLQGSRKEVEAGQAELTRSQQKVDSLQKLARNLSTENKALTDNMRRQKQHTESMMGLMENIQSRIGEQQEETSKVLEHNKLLLQENVLLKSQLVSTQETLDQLRTTQQDRIAAIAEQLEQQNSAMTQASKLHEALDGLMKENEALTLKAALANTFKERNDLLEKAFEECQAQAAHHRDQMAEMQDSLKKATKVLQSFEKLQKTMTDQQQVTTQLMQERQLLQQQVQLLQQQSRGQADKLRRTQLQKQRLEGLCRTLQARSGDASVVAEGLIAGAAAADSSDGPDEPPAAAGAGISSDVEAQACEGLVSRAAAGSTAECSEAAEAVGSHESAEGVDAAVAEVCHDVVQQALDSILQATSS